MQRLERKSWKRDSGEEKAGPRKTTYKMNKSKI